MFPIFLRPGGGPRAVPLLVVNEDCKFEDFIELVREELIVLFELAREF